MAYSAIFLKSVHAFVSVVRKFYPCFNALRLYDPKGLRVSGKPAYSPLLLFKILLLAVAVDLVWMLVPNVRMQYRKKH